MAELNTRLQLKIDSFERWNKWYSADGAEVATPNFKAEGFSFDAYADKGAALLLKKGEVALCEITDKSQGAQTAPTVLFKVGDGVKVHAKVREGDKERIQIFAGIVIARKGSGIHETFTVRRLSYGEGVERVFPMNSPRIAKIEVVRPGKVRRSKLYYIRDKVGKSAKIKELIVKKSDKVEK